MNRTDRMLAIVLELQAHGARRARDLAASFKVSKRTIYRHVQALCEAGVPVIAEAGRRYSLPAGYFLPPLRFSADEALMAKPVPETFIRPPDLRLGMRSEEQPLQIRVRFDPQVAA